MNRAVVRLWGCNSTSSSAVPVSVYGITDDTWTETELTWNNSPCHNPATGDMEGVGTSAYLLDVVNVDDRVMYYEFDVSDFIYSQLTGDNEASLVFVALEEDSTSYIDFSSDESTIPPELIVEY